jgi:putative flippase GtrA
MSEGDAISAGRVDAGEELAVSTRVPVTETEARAPSINSPTKADSRPDGESRDDPIEEGTTWLGAFLVRSRAQVARLVRYTATSVLAFALSEITLLVLYGSHAVGATTAALIANIVATVPSYLMSRYWIWKDARRTQVGRQVVLYWATSAASILLTSLATGAIAHHIPNGHRFHLALVGLAFFFVNVAFWLVKFVVYHKFIFPTDRTVEDVVVDASI